MAVGTGADRVLIAAGQIQEETYLRLLCDSLGVAFETMQTRPRDACSLDDEDMIRATRVGHLPLRVDGDLKLIVAPRGTSARKIIELVRSRPEVARRLRLTTGARLQAFVRHHAEATLEETAINDLAARWRDMSASPPRRRFPVMRCIAVGLAVLAAVAIAPAAVKLVADVTLAILFVAWMLLRVAGVVINPAWRLPRRRLRDRELPLYTILVPLYREANSIQGLIAALQRLDYPKEKLDVKLIVEPDDWETRNALAKYTLEEPFEIVIAPDAGPRTKPKALNAALPFARGAFTVIYDAEDRPERNQLRSALDSFLNQDDSLACVQASLTIDNTRDSWLTAMFTAEYAGLFDVFLPALTRFKMPLPLGGSSNHFRTSALRAVGAWDPYNVTEDADLGLRLARFGYRSMAINSSTYEEAPAQLGLWLKQRTRWMKGWMQTWLVHMRDPRRLRRELGLGSFLAIQLIVGGNVFASLLHPLLIGWLGTAFIFNVPLWSSKFAAALFAMTIVSGYLTSVVIGATGLFRRGLLINCWVLLLVPVHWLLLSFAAWRALFQLIVDPYRWEKTEHGLARTSRAKLDRRTEGALRLLAGLARRKRARSVVNAYS